MLHIVGMMFNQTHIFNNPGDVDGELGILSVEAQWNRIYISVFQTLVTLRHIIGTMFYNRKQPECFW